MRRCHAFFFIPFTFGPNNVDLFTSGAPPPAAFSPPRSCADEIFGFGGEARDPAVLQPWGLCFTAAQRPKCTPTSAAARLPPSRDVIPI